jgi:hypothetical protein
MPERGAAGVPGRSRRLSHGGKRLIGKRLAHSIHAAAPGQDVPRDEPRWCLARSGLPAAVQRLSDL